MRQIQQAKQIIETLRIYKEISKAEFYSNDRHQRISDFRLQVMYIVSLFTGITQKELGALVMRDRTQVNYAFKRVKDLCQVDQKFREDLDEMMRLVSELGLDRSRSKETFLIKQTAA